MTSENSREFLHKTWVGQPGSDPTVPAVLVLGWYIQQVVNVPAYAQILYEK